jgi:glycosyltransferase involved in cell wall biosynthesis
LEATLRSVLDQGYPQLEYIVQDGGSTDESLDILRRYGERLTRWESVPDRGQSDAINRGMQHTTGEIMAYLNSDDLLLPGSLAYVAGYFRDHPDVDIVYGHRLLVNEQGNQIGRWILPPHDDIVITWADYIPQETMFWRRRAWERAGGCIDDSFAFAMDWDLILRFREAGLRFARLPRFLGAFRITEEQKTSQLIATVGAREMARLRYRVHGAHASNRRIRRAVRPYIWRHWVYDTLYTAGLARY